MYARIFATLIMLTVLLSLLSFLAVVNQSMGMYIFAAMLMISAVLSGGIVILTVRERP